MEFNDAIAPFVMKTYQMVNDPSSDNLIRWGKSNNSFIVVDSLRFSQCLLHAFFKHSNFSSFIRQLNTYGFRKVDPDRCEFANEWFLRGQVHLLKKIGRKKQSNNVRGNFTRSEDDDEDDMAMEIARLKEEQKVLEKEMIEMRKRIEATERRPKQIMALLCQVAEDPQILPRMMRETEQKRLSEKKRQRTSPSPATSSGFANSVKCEEYEDSRSFTEGVVFWRSSTVADETLIRFPANKASGGVGGGCFDTDHGSGPVGSDVRPPPPYPFSLLGGGF